jgi:lipopolysaccharide transport system ATP-binding protein
MTKIIKAEGLSKQYRIGARRAAYATFRETASEALGAPLRLLRRRRDRTGEYLWALRDVSFDVEPGEVLGVVGRNGAGKSTLLKILSRITEPTKGRITLYGRVGSLLEVGTGFHPELSGRENIYLNGAILGMRRREIESKFDEIVAFAEVERFIDTPVKRYSSGMYMRLAFAVAAHLEPEILLVDEVLAVGDAVFQKKCLGKMGEVASQGRTVLFVSHNVAAVSQLCTRALLLSDGQLVLSGKTSEVVAEYFKAGVEAGGERVWEQAPAAPGNDRARLRAIRILSRGERATDVDIDQEVTIEVDFWNYQAGARELCVILHLANSSGITVLSTSNTPAANALEDDWFREEHDAGLFRAACTIPGNFLNEGVYYVSINVLTIGRGALDVNARQAISFNIFDTGVMREPGTSGRWDGVVRVRLPWRTQLLEPISSSATVENCV